MTFEVAHWRQPSTEPMTGKIFGLLLAAQLASSTSVWAESAASDAPLNADHLFEQGLAEMRAGQYGVGCPHLAQSYRVDPVPGALFTLAECEASWNKLARALAHYQSFLSALTMLPAARRDSFEERRRIAAGQVTALSVSAPELTLNVAPEIAPGLIVKADGELIPSAAYGVARRIDPGRYGLTAERAGQRVWTRTVELQAGNRAIVQVQLPLAPLVSGASSRASQHKKSLPAAAFVGDGVALAGLTTGIVAGLLAYGRLATIDRHCPARRCDGTGRAALNAARTEARISTIGFSCGIAGLAVATLAWLLPSSDRPASTGRAASGRAAWRVVGDTQGVRVDGEF